MVKANRPEDIAKWYRGKVQKNDARINGLMHAAAEFGEERVRYNIETRGTLNEWESSWDTMTHATPGRHVSEPGRDAGGDMVNAVSSWVSEGGDGKIRMAFGWTNPSSRKPYFLAQEGGFQHNFTSKEVHGMFAVRDAASEVFQWLSAEIGDALK